MSTTGRVLAQDQQIQELRRAVLAMACPACDYTDNGWCPCECHEADQ